MKTDIKNNKDEKLLLNLHSQFSDNQNHHQRLFILLIIALFVLFGTFGYILIKTENINLLQSNSSTVFSPTVFFSISIFISGILLFLNKFILDNGYTYRRDQYINQKIRVRFLCNKNYEEDCLNKHRENLNESYTEKNFKDATDKTTSNMVKLAIKKAFEEVIQTFGKNRTEKAMHTTIPVDCCISCKLGNYKHIFGELYKAENKNKWSFLPGFHILFFSLFSIAQIVLTLVLFSYRYLVRSFVCTTYYDIAFIICFLFILISIVFYNRTYKKYRVNIKQY